MDELECIEPAGLLRPALFNGAAASAELEAALFNGAAAAASAELEAAPLLLKEEPEPL